MLVLYSFIIFILCIGKVCLYERANLSLWDKPMGFKKNVYDRTIIQEGFRVFIITLPPVGQRCINKSYENGKNY